MPKRIVLEFGREDLEKVFKSLIEWNNPFEIIGNGIIVLPKNRARQNKSKS